MLDHFFPLLFPKDSESLKIIWHPTSGSGGKKTVKRFLKSEQTDTQTDGQTHRRTFRLVESINPKGRCFENVLDYFLTLTGLTTVIKVVIWKQLYLTFTLVPFWPQSSRRPSINPLYIPGRKYKVWNGLLSWTSTAPLVLAGGHFCTDKQV